MGYTHYYRGWLTLNENFVADARRIIDFSGVQICGGGGDGEPELLAGDHINLNGAGLHIEAHDSFWLQQGVNHTEGGFCKTGRKPYDAVVCAILLRAANRSKRFIVESDGCWDDLEEWIPARQLYFDALGEVAQKPQKLRLSVPLAASA